MMNFAPKVKYERSDLGDGNEDNPHAMVEIETARWVGELLNRYYPGHPWYVEVQIQARGGVIKIQLKPFMGDKHWYVVKMSDAISDPSGHLIRRGAGEILERYGFARTGFSPDEFRRALNLVPITGRGHLDPLR